MSLLLGSLVILALLIIILLSVICLYFIGLMIENILEVIQNIKDMKE